MKTVSIGYHREDGDFAILATLNNNDGHMKPSSFQDLVYSVTHALCHYTSLPVTVLERQDAPDYVAIDEPDPGPQTQQEARQWLIENDPEGADLWRSLPDEHDFLSAYRENIRDHGPL